MGQIAQGGVPRSKIIQRNLHLNAAQRGQLRQDMIIRLQQNRLRQLQLQIPGRQPRGGKRIQHQLIKIRLQKLGHGDVHRHGHFREALIVECPQVAAGLLQNPCSQGDNKMGILGHLNKPYR
ncbi:hypothetical protein D3C75_1113210 [compost metagenome]